MGNKLFKVKLFSLTIIPLKKNSSINPIIKPDKTDKRIVTKNTLSISFILKLKILISKICNKIIIGKEARILIKNPFMMLRRIMFSEWSEHISLGVIFLNFNVKKIKIKESKIAPNEITDVLTSFMKTFPKL